MFGNFPHLGGQIGNLNYIPGVDFLNHDLLTILKNSDLMRGQTLSWIDQKLFIQLVKHGHFMTKHLKLRILAYLGTLLFHQIEP